ncbi:MAG: T9SS type A sorting domain-containing protein [Paludibacteraceae bacterium]|nr:T9SS type A sorting domain-containing protein [Paludibacteraceae bacterium]
MIRLFDIIERISSRVGVKRMLMALMMVMVGVNAWGQEFTTTLTASVSALNQAKTIATWTENNVTFSLSGGSLTPTNDGNYYVLSPNTTYTLQWAVTNSDAYAFNVISEADAIVKVDRSWSLYQSSRDIIFNSSTGESLSTDNTFGQDVPLNMDNCNIPASGYLTIVTNVASADRKVALTTHTTNFKYYFRSITLTYSLFRKFHYSASVVSIKDSETLATVDDGVAYASFNENDFSGSLNPATGFTTATTPSQTNATIQAYFRAIPNEENHKVFVGWKLHSTDEAFLSTETNHSTTFTASSQNPSFRSNLTLYAVFGDKFERVVKYQDTDVTSVTLEVDDNILTAFSISDCGGENTLTPNDEDDFYYSVTTDSITDSIRGCDVNHTTDVITYNVAENKLQVWNAGRATITFHQKETGKIKGSNFSLTVNVVKHSPSFTWNNGNEDVNAGIYFNSKYSNIFESSSQEHNQGCVLSFTSTNDTAAKVVHGTNQFQASLVTYNDYAYPSMVACSTDITISQAENYYWEAKDTTFTITPGKVPRHVPFKYSEQLLNDNKFTILPDTVNAQWVRWTTEGVADSAIWVRGANNDEMYGFVIHFEGVPDTLKYGFKPKNKELTGDGSKQSYFFVFQSADSIKWEQVYFQEYSRTDKYEQKEFSLLPSTRYLKFIYSGNKGYKSWGEEQGGGYFSHIQVTELHTFITDPTSIDFDTISVRGGAPRQVIMLTHANAGYDINISSSNPSHFLVSPVSLSNSAEAENDRCGGDIYNVRRLNVTFVGTAEGEYKDSIIITDRLKQRLVIPIVGYRTLKDVPDFRWNPNDSAYFTGSTIPHIFTSNNPASVEYKFSKEGVVDIIGDTLVIGNVEDTVVVTVHQEGSDKWEKRTESYEVIVTSRPPLKVPFLMTKAMFDVNRIKTEENFSYWSASSDTNNDGKDGVKLVYKAKIGSIVIEDGFSWGHYDDKYVVYKFQGQPDSIFFYYGKNDGAATFVEWYIAESTDGINWNTAWTSEVKNTDGYTFASAKLNHNSHYIKLCYSGNYQGYFKDVQVTAYKGVGYLRCGDKYISRGGTDANQVVLDDYGVALSMTEVQTRKSDSDPDGSPIYTRYQYLDGKGYLNHSLSTRGTNPYESTKSSIDWVREGSIVQKPDPDDVNGYLVGSGTTVSLGSTGSSFSWESAENHAKQMKALRDLQAQEAAEEFGIDIESEDVLRGSLHAQNYESHTTTLRNASSIKKDEAESASTFALFSQQYPIPDTGFYKLTFYAFYRLAEMQYAYDTLYSVGVDYPVAYVQASFLNKSNKEKILKTQLCSVFSDFGAQHEGDFDVTLLNEKDSIIHRYYPASTASADEIFNQEGYENNIYFYIDKPNTELTYGLYSPSNANNSNSICYQNVKLTKYQRQSFYYNNKTGDKGWNNKDNWFKISNDGDTLTVDTFPRSVHRVILEDTVYIKSSNAAFSITYSTEEKATPAIVIEPTGSLSVHEGGFVDATPSIPKITIQANADNTGFIRVSPKVAPKTKDMPLAYVQMYSKAYYERVMNPETGKYNSDEANWQYLGTPVMNDADAWLPVSIFYQDWLYRWDEKHGWRNVKKEQYSPMIPFNGYSLTQMVDSGGKTYTYKGRLISGKLDTLLLYTLGKQEGKHLLANSFAAPIDIRKFNIYKDFGSAIDPTIYIYNTGCNKDAAAEAVKLGEENSDASGQFTAIPISAVSALAEADPTLSPYIAPMQGFMIKRNEEGNGRFVLYYDSLVWNGQYEVERHPNNPMRAPRRSMQVEPDTNCLYMQVFGQTLSDKLFLFENEQFHHTMDRGWDAEKMEGSVALSLFAVEDSLRMAVDATPQMKGTYIGFHSDADSVYHIRFKYVETAEQLYFLDQQTGKAVPMAVDTTWTFSALPDSLYSVRFRIVDESMLPVGWDVDESQTTTGIDNTVGNGVIEMWQSGNNVYATGVGTHIYRLYDMQGKLITTERFAGSYVHNLSSLPMGVYVASVENKMIKVVVK